MIKLRKDLSRFAPEKQLERMVAAHDGLAAHTTEFPAPTIALATVKTHTDALDTNLKAIKTTEDALKSLRAQRVVLLATAQSDYSRNGSYVESKAGDDMAMAMLSAYEPAGDASNSAGPVGQVVNVVAAMGKNDGEMTAHYDSEPNADGYETRLSPDPITATSWVSGPSTGRTKITFTGLPGMAKHWVSVRAFRGDEHGPWSDPACAVVS